VIETELFEKIEQYNPDFDKQRIKSAYQFAQQVHQGQERLSGKPFLSHSLEVAKLVAELKLGDNSIMAAILHDVLDEGKKEVTLEELEKEFGVEVALLVDGVSTFRQAAHKFPMHQESVEYFQKFLLASVDDIRVLLIRLADKVHNSRTIEALPEKQQERFAKRVLHLYSPLAEYAGLGAYKRELDDKAFAILYLQDFKWLRKKLAKGKKRRKDSLKELIAEVENILNKKNIVYERIYGRAKGYWSIWKKIRKYLRKGKITKRDPSAVLDQIGVTILAQDINHCYAALGVVHSNWNHLPEEFDDYVSNPKPNGYRSIQTTIQWHEGTAEVQIKTPQMHEFNEFGPASHIAYKIAGGKSKPSEEFNWVKELVSWKEGEKRKQYQVQVFADYVYVLTPKGDILQLPKGATPVDFAYQIHTELGNLCGRAKVNGEMVKLDHQLKSGDVVEIIPVKERKSPPDHWLDFVVTEKAKRKIRKNLTK
jgi:GTP pyrophosphokinase